MSEATDQAERLLAEPSRILDLEALAGQNQHLRLALAALLKETRSLAEANAFFEDMRKRSIDRAVRRSGRAAPKRNS